MNGGPGPASMSSGPRTWRRYGGTRSTGPRSTVAFTLGWIETVLPPVLGRTGTSLFHRVLEPLPVKQWQLEQTSDGLVLRIAPGDAAVAADTIVGDLQTALAAAGARPPAIDVVLVAAVVKTPLGKAPLIKAFRPNRR